MSSLRKLERDFAHADIAAVSSLVAQLGDEDVMARFGLESRLQRLRAAAAKLDETPEAPTASAALFFGGRPVLGQNGIEAEFGAAAVANFQDLVAKVIIIKRPLAVRLHFLFALHFSRRIRSNL